MNRTRRIICMLLALVVFASATHVWAADVTAKIRGTVTDANNAVVPGASVTALNTQTGLTYTTKSASDGGYELLNLPVGTYKLTVQSDKFKTFVATGITLQIDQVYLQNASLQLGSKDTVIEVTAAAVQVDRENIQLGTNINSQQIVDLPLIGRNFTQLELLVPGVQASNDRFGTFSANGAQTQQSSFLINGTDTNDLPLNTPVFVPSPDAIGQFNFVTSSLNPEYSRNSGAVVNASIKNGTNQFHGSAFDFYRNTFLNGHNWFQSTSPKLQQNVFGGTLGGPIWKDKAFFFISYQGTRATTPQATSISTLYSAAQLAGNWAGTPFSNNPIPGSLAIPGCPAGTTWSACLGASAGVVPGGAATFNSLSKSLVTAFLPTPNTAGNQFTFNASTKNVADQGIMRLDYNLTSKDQLWFVMTQQHNPSADDLPFTGATLPGFGETATRETKQYTASWTHTINSTTLNEVRVGFTRLDRK